MATSVEYIEFVCEQLREFGEVRYRKMFGEYMAYLHEKPVLLVCDNTVFVKKLPEVRELLAQADCGAPYHRECYEKLGRCIHTPAHGAGYELSLIHI